MKLLYLLLACKNRKCERRCASEEYGWDINGKLRKIKKYLPLITKIELVLILLVPLLGLESLSSERWCKAWKLQSWPWGMTNYVVSWLSVWAVLRLSWYIKENQIIFVCENSDFWKIWKHIFILFYVLECIHAYYTLKKPKTNLKYLCRRRQVVNHDSGTQSSQRYMDVFSIKKIENPSCKKLQWWITVYLLLYVYVSYKAFYLIQSASNRWLWNKHR